MAYIEVNQVKKTFGRVEAIRGASFSVERGELFGFLGPNGAGKSTLLGMIGGLLKIDAGKITVNGVSVADKPMTVKRQLGWVPQDIALYPKLSAQDNLVFWGQMYGIPKPVLRNRVSEVLDMVGLCGRAHDPIGHYSGGMKRRINIAAGILHRPELLILDEPTVGVDPQSRNHIFELIRHLNQTGVTIIYTSHYMEEVESLCERVAVIDQGQMVALGTVADLLRQAGENHEITIQAHHISPIAAEQIKTLPLVREVTLQDSLVRIITTEAEKTLAGAFAILTSAGTEISRIEIHKPNLETMFIKLTGKTLRDET